MPKAELHLHIEGTLEPELIFELAQKNGVALAYPSVEALRAAYAFTDLQSFLDIYYAGASVLLHASDFEAMAMAYFRRAAADNVVHAEIFFDPQTHTARGVAIGAVIEGLAAARERARRELGLTSELILCFLRHLSEDEAIATLEQALPYPRALHRRRPRQQRARPSAGEVRARVRARRRARPAPRRPRRRGRTARLHRERARRAPASSASTTACAASRTRRWCDGWRGERTPLTVCPLSNVKLCVYRDMAEHSLAELLAAGLCATVNSDDPAYFGGYINDNFVAAFAALPQLDARHAHALAANSFEASFADPAMKRAWRARLDAVFAGD